MRKHNGMRPQDVAILLKIIAMQDKDWQMQHLANELSISLSEVSESLNRSRIARLIDFNKKKINRQSLLEFLEHGVQYVFPQEVGAMVRGIPTAHSHPFMKKHFASDMHYVWADASGELIGSHVEPFYPKQVEAVKKDPLFYKLLALIDVIRLGKVREIKLAKKELENLLA